MKAGKRVTLEEKISDDTRQGLVNLNRSWDVGARVAFTDDSDNIGLFGRYNF